MQTPPESNAGESKRAPSCEVRLGILLGAVGFCGVASCLLIDLERLMALLPVPAEGALPVTTGLLALSLVQPTVLLAGAVIVGVHASRRTGLRAPVFEAVARRAGEGREFGRAVPIGVTGGIVGGAAILATAALVRPDLPADVTARIAGFMGVMPLPTRLLYGGITEEVLLRWGFMNALAWVGWRLWSRGQAGPSAGSFIAAIAVSALVFGVAHLPLAYFLVPDPSLGLVGFVIVANSVFGVVAGWLFWRRGLEAAMVAHVVTHVVLWFASRAGAYF